MIESIRAGVLEGVLRLFRISSTRFSAGFPPILPISMTMKFVNAVSCVWPTTMTARVSRGAIEIRA
jgi:hypothetical protein